MKCLKNGLALLVGLIGVGPMAFAQPSSVVHVPTNGVFGEPVGITQREPDAPREDDLAAVYIRVGNQFTYDRVCIYYTTDGSEPAGSFGTPSGTTQVLRNDLGSITFLRNEGGGPVLDWWKANLPVGTRAFNQTIKYKISAWKPFVGGEVFANGGASYSFTNKLAWPGAGAGQPSPSLGYPPVNFWKEEAIFGNTYTAGMIDQNGSVYDFHFPTVGGVYGVGTKNEGYVDGLDTFPAGLPPAWRGQMHVNQAMPGIRVDGVTHWLSNPAGVSYTGVDQEYLPGSNTVKTTQTLTFGGNNIAVEQYDFAPIGIAFPTDNGGAPQRHIYLKRMRLTNNGPTTKTVNVYWYLDPAINGGDTYDGMLVDPAKNAMVAFDNTYRVVTGTGTGFTSPNEYNPTTSPGYEKNKSLYLASAMKVLDSVGGIATKATDYWRDTSGDNSQGWMGAQATLAPGVPVEVCFVMVGGCDNFAGATGTYTFQLSNVMQWFYDNAVAGVQTSTDTYWNNWLASGTTIDFQDADYDRLMERGLLGTALHVDAVNGGVIAGFHNGAYPYVWPRDAVYAAVTLARVGHLAEAGGVYQWMKDITFRDFEGWGRKGFWKQKYSTDGYVIWGAPQIDETAVFPWGIWWQYSMTNDEALLNTYIEQVRDSVETMTRTSTIDPVRLQWTPFNLSYSNNVWEDSYDTFIYSNANIWRGLEDARKIFDALSLPGDAFNALNKRNLVKSGLDARLDWDGENTDISQLGIVYPFEVYAPNDFRSTRVIDRINGVRKKFNNTHPTAEPLVNFAGEHQDTVNRYWGDSYWNGGPWFLTTLWYGLYYANRQDETPGKGDIDNHKYRVDLMIDRLGPAGLGAEQIAYGTGGGASLMYPGQQDFKLQTAWPNAWESMSTFVDSIMAFIEYKPEAYANTMNFEPKLPTAWSNAQGMTFKNIKMVNVALGATHSVDLTVAEPLNRVVHAFKNNSNTTVQVKTVLRVDTSRCLQSVSRNGVAIAYTLDGATGRISVDAGNLDLGVGATTNVVAAYRSADVDDGNASGVRDGGVGIEDLLYYLSLFESGSSDADVDDGSGLGLPDGGVGIEDLLFYLGAFEAGCV